MVDHGDVRGLIAVKILFRNNDRVIRKDIPLRRGDLYEPILALQKSRNRRFSFSIGRDCPYLGAVGYANHIEDGALQGRSALIDFVDLDLIDVPFRSSACRKIDRSD